MGGASHGNESDQAAQREMGAGIAASPHLRRAKDLPVFASLAAFAPRSSILAHQLRRRFRKWSCPEGQVLFHPRPFLDQSPFASPAPRRTPRLAQERMALPAPLPAGPTWNRSSSSSPAGGDRTFRPFLTLLSLPTVRGGWDIRPDHPFVMRLATSRSKRNLQPQACG